MVANAINGIEAVLPLPNHAIPSRSMLSHPTPRVDLRRRQSMPVPLIVRPEALGADNDFQGIGTRTSWTVRQAREPTKKAPRGLPGALVSDYFAKYKPLTAGKSTRCTAGEFVGDGGDIAEIAVAEPRERNGRVPAVLFQQTHMVFGNDHQSSPRLVSLRVVGPGPHAAIHRLHSHRLGFDRFGAGSNRSVRPKDIVQIPSLVSRRCIVSGLCRCVLSRSSRFWL